MKLYCPVKCHWLNDGICMFNAVNGVPWKSELEKDGDRYVRADNCKPSQDEKTRFYFEDVESHIRAVAENLHILRQELRRRGREHDKHKRESVEAESYIEPVFILNNSDIKFGTPEYKEVTATMGKGWKHHLENHDHHIKHHEKGLKDMDLLMVLEMLCDWIAASERNGGHFDFEKSWKFAVVAASNESEEIKDTLLKELMRNTADFILSNRV